MAKLNVPIGNQKVLAEPINMAVFVFNTKGQFLESATVNDKGVADLKSLDTAKDVQILLLPEPDKSVYKLRTIEELLRYRPYRPKLIPFKGGYQTLPVPDVYLNAWNFKVCRVTGIVSKQFVIDDAAVRLPLCKARVHICEIDKILWWIPQIPDDIILRIPDIFKKPIIEIQKPWPPIPIDPFNLPIHNVKPIRGTTPLTTAKIKLNRLDNNFAVVNALPKVNTDTLRAFQSRNPALIRSALIRNIELLHPYFCFAPWLWPYFYKCDELRTVYTDQNGRYESDIVYLAKGDQPDIYIWVEYLIDGQWMTVYKPPVPCNTHWDYACGTDININVTDRRVRPGCGSDLEQDAIWVRAIGNFSVRSVSQNAAGAPIQGVTFNRLGLFRTGGDYRSPLSTTVQSSHMQLIVKFGTQVPNNTAKYYRWGCMRIADGNLAPDSSSVRYLNDSVNRTYVFEYHEDPSDLTSPTHFSSGSVNLGPKVEHGKASLFLIPPKTPVGWEGVAIPSAEWSMANTVTTNVDTNALFGDGLYRFWLEIFDKNGNQVNKNNAFFQIPKANDASESEDASAPYVGVLNGFNAFQMLVRVDNNNCAAAIYPVRLTSPNRVADDCGFIKYDDLNAKSISISFKAFHPFNFANLSFTVVRGNVGTGGAGTPASASGMVIGPVGRYERDAMGDYEPRISPTDDEFTAAELLGTCAANKRAAFAQSLYVSALHTDGYRTLHERDDSALAAFALEG